MSYLKKIKTREELRAIVEALKSEGKVVVQCHGCFDILHPGHFRHLAWAADQGDVLIVTVSADQVLQKGANRPYVPHDLRAENLAAVEVVDTVGAGDAFLAVFVLGRRRAWDSGTILRRAVDFAASVCTLRGAITRDRSFYRKWLERWEEAGD